ncbi:MAG: Cation/acetate symporter ActP [Halieaceae bacterium]|nr:MAG: Cation/acetate symporter ActP [Halieaceae bacterium]
MSLTETTYLVVGASFALYIFIAIRSRAGSTQEFYVAGKGIHPVANGMATAADWMSAASFISMAGLIGLSYNGYGGSVFLMGWTGGYVILAMLIAPYLRKYGKFTVPEFIGDRYYSNTARIVAVICLIICSVTYVIGQMKGIGVAFSRFLETDYETGLFSGMVIVFFYAVLGGMKGITYTQIAQFCVLIFAYTVPAIFISLQLTGQPVPQIGLGSTLADGTYLLEKLDRTLLDLGFQEYTTSVRGSTLNMAAFTASLMIGTAGLPHVIIRFFTVPTVRAARTSAGWALVFIAILYTTAPAVAAMARLNILQTLEPQPGQHLAVAERPAWFKNWEQTGLLGIEDKNGDGLIQYSADPDTNELVTLDNDILVLANPEIAKLPNWVIALVAAGGLAAALSTAAGLLLAISSAISHDLLKRTLMPDISERQELMASRLAMAGAVLGAGYLGLNPPGFAAGTVALAFGLAASSLFPALLLGIFSKRVTREGAVLGMLAGIGVTLAYVFQHKGIMFIPGTSFLGDLPPNWFLGIEPNAFGVVGAIVNFSVTLTVSRLTAPPPASVQQLVEEIRVPVSSS